MNSVELNKNAVCQNVIITGASKGIGKAIAEKFAAQNCNLFLCSRNEIILSQTARDIHSKHKGCEIKYYAADLSNKKYVKEFAEWLLKQNASIDILINNAGDFLPGNIYDEAEGTLEKMMEVNLYSAYHLTRALLPKLMEQKSGHIFNMCSIAALQAYPGGGSYSISKFALSGFSKNLREEMKTHNIKVTAVYPGAVYTSSWADSGVKPDRIMPSSDIAQLIYSASQLSPQACVEEIVIRPQAGDL